MPCSGCDLCGSDRCCCYLRNCVTLLLLLLCCCHSAHATDVHGLPIFTARNAGTIAFGGGSVLVLPLGNQLDVIQVTDCPWCSDCSSCSPCLVPMESDWKFTINMGFATPTIPPNPALYIIDYEVHMACSAPYYDIILHANSITWYAQYTPVPAPQIIPSNQRDMTTISVSLPQSRACGTDDVSYYAYIFYLSICQMQATTLNATVSVVATQYYQPPPADTTVRPWWKSLF